MSGGDRNGRVDLLRDAALFGAVRTIAKPFGSKTCSWRWSEPSRNPGDQPPAAGWCIDRSCGAGGGMPFRRDTKPRWPPGRRGLACAIGAPGFEPGTSCSQSRRATGLRHAPLFFCCNCLGALGLPLKPGVSQDVCKNSPLSCLFLPQLSPAEHDGQHSGLIRLLVAAEQASPSYFHPPAAATSASASPSKRPPTARSACRFRAPRFGPPLLKKATSTPPAVPRGRDGRGLARTGRAMHLTVNHKGANRSGRTHSRKRRCWLGEGSEQAGAPRTKRSRRRATQS
jgi:hypothetical protein